MFNKLIIPPFSTMRDCVERLREVACREHHPTCLIRNTTLECLGDNCQKKKLCRETCESFKEFCTQTLQFLLRSQQIIKLCPIFSVTRDLGIPPKCKTFSPADIRYPEKCYLERIAGTKVKFRWIYILNFTKTSAIYSD